MCSSTDRSVLVLEMLTCCTAPRYKNNKPNHDFWVAPFSAKNAETSTPRPTVGPTPPVPVVHVHE